jgi:hypothetical protein
MMTTPVATLYYCRRPCRAAGRIVLPQTRQTDHGNLCFLNPDHLFFVIARFELDAGDRSKDLNSNGRHSHANHVNPLKEQAERQFSRGEAELARRVVNPGRVFRTDLAPHVLDRSWP